MLRLSLTILVCAVAPLCAQNLWTSDTFKGLELRSIGPSLASGRVTSIAVDTRNRARYFVGVASGGVWQTENNGTTWTPVFDKEGSYSIGTVVLDPKNSSTVWVGTGENNAQRSVGYGDGLYKSTDGGKSWQNVGLKTSEHIGRIVIDPRDSRVVYVAAQGPLWGPGGDRGLYKTTDGGKTWDRILNISENTGVTDVAMDPFDPDTLLAAAHQRRRHVWTLINGGPESALHKTTDGGKTWRKITSGLPSEELGRIGLAYSPAQRGLVYAHVEAANEKSAIFRSSDSGESWEKRNPYTRNAMYYGQIIADPRLADRLYVMDTYAQVSNDGGMTLKRVGDRSKHIDTHTFWIDPTDSNFILSGCDGGVYESHDAGRIWQFKSNLPVTQFYNVTVDDSKPYYYIYGGTQDNATLGGPSRTRNVWGIVNADWFIPVFGDGFVARVDPADPNTVYAESQYGGLVRYDRRTGERIGIKPVEAKGQPPLRWNWESPLIISPHSASRLYFAANILFRSDDRGNSWRAVSGDLTRQIDRNSLPVMGKVWSADAVAKSWSTSFYSNITAIAESPKQEGLLYAGTDDGLVQISENGGGAWRKVETFAGIPEKTYVQRVLASLHDANTVFAAFDGHKNSDFKPYLLKSTDRGATWTSIAGDLPANGPVLAIAEDHIKPDLLFAGTEFGVFFTVNGGKNWVQLKGGLPTIAVRDLAIQKRENDLVLATFGRGFYVFDDYSPLRTFKPEEEVSVFPVKDATLYVEAEPYALRGKAFQGESFYTAPNPPFGAVITYYLKDAVETKREQRRAAEKKGASGYPSNKQLSDEAEEETPAILLTVTDDKGKVVRRFGGPVTKGFHRVAWDLRTPAAVVPDNNELASEFFFRPSGILVGPGTYQVSLARRVNGVTTAIGTPQKIRVVADSQTHPARWEFQQKMSRVQRTLNGSRQETDALRQKLEAIRKALDSAAAPDNLLNDWARIRTGANNVRRALSGDPELQRRQENEPTSISDRIGLISYEQRLTTSAPTQTHEQSLTVASEELAAQVKTLRTLLEELRKLEQAMDAAGVAPTPGRIPPL
jgi:photosystem II stability/assembly factor-like uncharacterized protein